MKNIAKICLAIAAVAATLSLAACGGGSIDSTDPTAAAPSPTSSPSPTSQPKTADAARAVALEEAQRYYSGDYAGAWDLWDKQSQAAISRADYVKLNTECLPLALGVKPSVSAIRLDGPGKAVATLSILNSAYSYTLHYERGQWRWHQADDIRAGYGRGVDTLIQEHRDRGECGGN